MSLKLGFRESGRRDTEIALLRDEARRRDEELSLLREQLAEERNEREKQLHADLVAERGISFSSASTLEYDVKFTNVGPHLATQIAAWLEDRTSTRIGNPSRVAALQAGQDATVKLQAPPVADAWLGPYGVFVEWWDGRGYQSRSTGLRLERP